MRLSKNEIVEIITETLSTGERTFTEIADAVQNYDASWTREQITKVMWSMTQGSLVKCTGKGLRLLECD